MLKQVLIIFLLCICSVSAFGVNPRAVTQGEEITVRLESNDKGYYGFIPVYDSSSRVVDIFNLDCLYGICYDGFYGKYIVDLNSGDYFFSSYSYKSNTWTQISFRVLDGYAEYITDDENEINNKPVIENIPNIKVSVGDSVGDIYDLNEFSNDPDDDMLSFYFVKEVPECYIKNNIFGCNSFDTDGDRIIEIGVSDGNKKDETNFLIEVVEVLENRNPVASVGDDMNVLVDQNFILDASNSYDLDGNLKYYRWKINDQIIGEGERIPFTFSEEGVYEITLEVEDSLGEIDKDSLVITVEEKKKCRNTNTLYCPDDTICDNKWLSNEGKLIRVNTKGYSCDLIEVCSDELDYIIEEAIDCCDGSLLQGDKFRLCSFANMYSDGRAKRCQALYLIYGLGSYAVYMQDYFEAEMCCYGAKSFCVDENNFYKALPFPISNIKFNFLNCETRKKLISDETSGIRGWWNSDSDMSKNNIALSDIPAHVSLNLLSTGTCVDYSFALTTLLRKIGYKEVYSIESKDHAFNLVKLDGDDKYTIVDTDGNGYSMVFNGLPAGYDYCDNIEHCYNDNGEQRCPSNDKIFICEKGKKSFEYSYLIVILLIVIIVFVVLWRRRK